jgi:CheY-like chemotaxis protein
VTAAPILLVEDDANDVFFFDRAVKKVGIAHPLHVTQDGQQAIDYLAGNGEFADRARYPKPGLIVLDLNLPVKHGLEVLKWIRQNRDTHTTVVIVLTSSGAELDMHEAYALGANSYLVKPADPTALATVVDAIKTYWLTFNRPPPAIRETRSPVTPAQP